MSTASSSPAGSVTTEQAIDVVRRQIDRIFGEVAQLSEQDLTPVEYYGEFLRRVLEGIAAPAGAIWLRNPQGHLQLQCQINLRQLGLDEDEGNRRKHHELIRHSFQTARPLIMPPNSSAGAGDAANPTAYALLLAPLLADKQPQGLIEVCQDYNRAPNVLPKFLQYLVRMAGLASSYARNYQLRQMVGQQQVWMQLEAFTRQVHASLLPTEVAYLCANEGRRLIGCDRVSIAVRRGRHTSIEAISGADVVEKRSNLVRLMASLCGSVVVWGERLLYNGAKDDSLPPQVLEALDAYLAESNSKLLVIQPLRDDRQGEEKTARAALMMESFEPTTTPEPLMARLEVVTKHCTTALYNAEEHGRIPFRWIWVPIAKVQDGLGGKARSILYMVAGITLFVFLMLLFVPFPLRMDSTGKLLPQERQMVYSPVPGQIMRFDVNSGATVTAGTPLIQMHSSEFEQELMKLQLEIDNAGNTVKALERQMGGLAANPNNFQGMQIAQEVEKMKTEQQSKQQLLDTIRARTNAEQKSGFFSIIAPMDGQILSTNFKENLTKRAVRPSDPLLRIGNVRGEWHVELKIPQRHIGQVRQAFPSDDPEAELNVALLLETHPTETYQGKLKFKDVAGEAVPDPDDSTQTEPVVIGWVRIEGEGIDNPVPRYMLLANTRVHTKINCGNHAMIYSLFYGVWEFFYEKVVFLF